MQTIHYLSVNLVLRQQIIITFTSATAVTVSGQNTLKHIAMVFGTQ